MEAPGWDQTLAGANLDLDQVEQISPGGVVEHQDFSVWRLESYKSDYLLATA